MRKRRIDLSVPKASVGSVEYLCIEHSCIGPMEVLRSVVSSHGFGVLILGSDGPSLLASGQGERYAKAMEKEQLYAEMIAGFLWLSVETARRICERDWFTCEGSAFLLKRHPPDMGFTCSELPNLSGFNKDALSPKAISTLEGMLSPEDIYVHDDFSETLVVTKDDRILDRIADEVERLHKACQGEGSE